MARLVGLDLPRGDKRMEVALIPCWHPAVPARSRILAATGIDGICAPEISPRTADPPATTSSEPEGGG